MRKSVALHKWRSGVHRISGSSTTNSCASFSWFRRRSTSSQMRSKLTSTARDSSTRQSFLDMLTGLRRGELAGLKWEDFDFQNLLINVTRSLVDQRVGKCKTEVSQKPVPMDEYIAGDLLEWYQQTPFRKPSDWVFATDSNRAGAKRGKQPLWLSTVMRYHIQPTARKLGFAKKISWHTFRHTYSTILKANGEDVKVVQELLRHASARITLDIYSQALSPQKRAAQSKVVSMIRSQKKTECTFSVPRSPKETAATA
jgi:integrase